MKSLTKSFVSFAAAAVIALSVFAGLLTAFTGSFSSAAATDNSAKYFYTQISNDTLAKNFYEAFEKLADDGEFKKGVIEYDLVANGVASKEVVQSYVKGFDNNRFVKAYGMGRDAFYMDHPDLFYADVFSTSISAGQKDGEYVAYLDSSRVLTTYRGNINSEAAVNNAIQAYETAIKAIVDEAKKAGGVKEQITYVNNYIAKNNNYGYGTEVVGDRNVDTPKAAYVFTSYGALVNKESVCEGYAKSFKAVMDRLGIPCVCIQGSADGDKDGNYQPHMWNAVQVEGMWYGVDVTYNATEKNYDKWLLVGGQNMFDTHIEDGEVSTSGYELRYPALKPYEYGNNVDSNEMVVVGSYTDSDLGKILSVSVSYEGKGAKKLQDEGKYLAYRMYSEVDDVLSWSPWANVIAINEAMDMDIFLISDIETKIDYIAPQVKSIQFALINRAPDSLGDMFTGNKLVSYDIDKLKSEDFCVAPTMPYQNEGYATYNPAPGVTGTSPSNSADLPVDKTYELRVTYSEKLALEDGKTEKDIDMDFVVSRENDIAHEYAKVSNVKWDGDKTITFTFTPSKMYVHNAAPYYFTPTALIGVTSKKIPNSVRFSFAGQSIVCNKILPGGQLYMNVFGQPKMLDNSDLSVTDFKDENGKYFAESQRSQMLLVASKPAAEQEEKMDEVLKKETGVKDSDVVASSTYEINLQICGIVPKIPNGTYFQVSFGFPEGYYPDDEGTTFKIYHYKTDSKGNILGVEEIPVIITQYGLIAKVTSFSPFTVVQLKNTSAAVGNSSSVNVYAYVNGGEGGTIKTDGKSGITEVVGDTIIYDISADEGYMIGCVRLNGEILKPSAYRDGKLTLNKAELKSGNMLEVQFVTEQSAKSYAEKGIALSYSVIDEDMGSPSKNNVTGIVVGCVVAAVVVLAAGGFAAWWFLVKKKQPAASGASKQAKKPANTKTKSTANRPVKTADKKPAAKSAAAKPAAKSAPKTASKTTTKTNTKKK